MTVLVTGAAGSVGRALNKRLNHRLDVIATDIAGATVGLDVTDRFQVARTFDKYQPDLIYHLAGAKHAPAAELDPDHAVRINITGTANVLRYAAQVGAKVVMSSTCKACDPETAYGASKLIAERLVLNAGGTVARYYNIPESDGNVFRLWESLPVTEPIPWTDCWRYFISMERAVALTLVCADLPAGRYTVDPGLPQHMRTVAETMYPDRNHVQVPRRRGDRDQEPLKAACEELWPAGDGVYRVVGAYDPQPAALPDRVAAA